MLFCIPCKVLTPLIMDVIERKTEILKVHTTKTRAVYYFYLQKWPKANAPLQIALVGLM